MTAVAFTPQRIVKDFCPQETFGSVTFNLSKQHFLLYRCFVVIWREESHFWHNQTSCCVIQERPYQWLTWLPQKFTSITGKKKIPTRDSGTHHFCGQMVLTQCTLTDCFHHTWILHLIRASSLWASKWAGISPLPDAAMGCVKQLWNWGVRPESSCREAVVARAYANLEAGARVLPSDVGNAKLQLPSQRNLCCKVPLAALVWSHCYKRKVVKAGES